MKVAAASPGGGTERQLSSLDAHVRMRCDMSGRRSYWYYSGTVFGKPEGELTEPMLAVEGISFSTLERLPEGRYRYRLTEAGYYLDPNSRQLEPDVVNPFTGQRYEPKHYLSSQTNILAPDLSVTPDVPRLPPGLEYRGVITPLSIFKNTVWSSEDLFVRMPVPSAQDDKQRPNFNTQTSLATLVADRQQLFDRDRDDIECQLHYQTLAGWKDWMNMGVAPGVISSRFTGTKCGRDDLPRALVDRVADEHDGFFDA